MIGVAILFMMTQLAEPYEKPEQYYEWWQEVAECSAYEVTSAELNSIEFWHVNAPSFMANGITGYTGYAYVENNQIFIVRAYKNNKNIIKHEMLHFILWWRKGGYEGRHLEEYSKCLLGLDILPWVY